MVIINMVGAHRLLIDEKSVFPVLIFSTEIYNLASVNEVTELARANHSLKVEISDFYRITHGLATFLIYFLDQMS